MKVVKPLRLNVRPRPAGRQGHYPSKFSVLAPTTTEVAPRLHSGFARYHYAADGMHAPSFATECTERLAHPLPERPLASLARMTQAHRNMSATIVDDRHWRRARPVPAVYPPLMSLDWCPASGCLHANGTSPKAFTLGSADRLPSNHPLRFRPPDAPSCHTGPLL
ncbi:hypothetical protein [Serratia sp. AKBS12]|uniref:hypothetical protein n=1 Tax=Serratia sp. AKBS12 TaxID=2974597 RepID=UPI0021654071|nr:hypothetical protein [Serratia sp. AKBS12]MCS3408137.1 hypothetical protein [Serratia sp. AKBS12]